MPANGPLILGLDPSSTTTGYAILNGPDNLREAGLFAPTNKRAPALERIAEMIDDLTATIADYHPSRAVIEITSGKVGKRHGGQGAGLAVYGMAVGALWWATVKLLGPDQVTAIDENTWTQGIPKRRRQMELFARFPKYADWANGGNDPGADAADAIGVARWWMMREQIKQVK